MTIAIDKKTYIITGGTINRVSPHFALSAPAYGQIGELIYEKLSTAKELSINLIKTKMADPKFSHQSITDAGLKSIETNADLKQYILHLNSLPDTGVVIMSAAIADFEINLPDELKGIRLSSSQPLQVTLTPAEKLLPLLREDIFTVSFKTLYNEEKPAIADSKAKKNMDSSDIIFVNDIGLKTNGVAINNNFKWLKSRKETIDVICMKIFSHYDLFNRLCIRCGTQTPETFGSFVKGRCPCCDAKRNSLMHFKTILSYKYGL